MIGGAIGYPIGFVSGSASGLDRPYPYPITDPEITLRVNCRRQSLRSRNHLFLNRYVAICAGSQGQGRRAC